MKLDENDEKYIRDVQKNSKIPLWASIAVLLSSAYVAIINIDKIGLQGLVTIEVMILLSAFLIIAKKRNENKLIDIIEKLIKP